MNSATTTMCFCGGLLILLVGSISAVVIPTKPRAATSQDWYTVMTNKEHANLFQSLGQPIICPGGSECPEYSTCCIISSGGYGCCPFPEAVCCSDGIHCCPKNTNCDISAGRCSTNSPNDQTHPLGKKFLWPKTLKLKGAFKTVTCEDKQSECPDDTTCCQLPTGDWGCCPFEHAVCCSDKQHCCPKDTVCDLAKDRCQKHQGSRTGFSLQKLYVYGNTTRHAGPSDDFSTIACPDHQQHCTDESTCCKLISGKYGCCPFEKADCCVDGLHCCPQGYTCNVKAGKCDQIK